MSVLECTSCAQARLPPTPPWYKTFFLSYLSEPANAGYTVDADVTNVALSSVTPASPTTSTATPSKGGSSTNVGAIVGGVVGGVAAVALVTVLALWLVAKKKHSSRVSTPPPPTCTSVACFQGQALLQVRYPHA